MPPLNNRHSQARGWRSRTGTLPLSGWAHDLELAAEWGKVPRTGEMEAPAHSAQGRARYLQLPKHLEIPAKGPVGESERPGSQSGPAGRTPRPSTTAIRKVKAGSLKDSLASGCNLLPSWVCRGTAWGGQGGALAEDSVDPLVICIFQSAGHSLGPAPGQRSQERRGHRQPFTQTSCGSRMPWPRAVGAPKAPFEKRLKTRPSHGRPRPDQSQGHSGT